MTISVEGSVGAKCCGELRDIYCRMGRLKEIIEEMHDGCVTRGDRPDFDSIETAWILTRDIYEELERYILPIVGPDSVFRRPGDEEPVCPM